MAVEVASATCLPPRCAAPGQRGFFLIMRTACASIDQGGGSGDFAWNQAKCRNVGIGTFGRNVALCFRTRVFDIQSARHAVDKVDKAASREQYCSEMH
jgi:hypothetical protein